MNDRSFGSCKVVCCIECETGQRGSYVVKCNVGLSCTPSNMYYKHCANVYL